MLDAITLLGANNAGNDTDFDAWTKVNRAVACANAGQLQGFKNRVMNGAMAVDQRVTAGVSVGVGASVFGPDRWISSAAGAAVAMFRSAISPALAGYRWQLQFNGAASNTNITVRQRIEAENSADLAGRSVALSFWVYHTLGAARQLQVNISRANVTDDFSGVTLEGSVTTAAVSAGAWTRVVVTMTMSSAATTGLDVLISSNGAVLAGQVFCITGVQLEAGAEDTAFEARPVGLELALCQRYAFRIGGVGTFDLLGIGFVATATQVELAVQFPQRMRAVPSLVVGSQSGFQANDSTVAPACTSVALLGATNNTIDRAGVLMGGFTGLTPGRAARVYANGTTNGWMLFAAEL